MQDTAYRLKWYHYHLFVPINRVRPEDRRRVWKAFKRVVLYLEDIDDLLVPLQKLSGEVQLRSDDFAGTLLCADELTMDTEGKRVNEMRRLILTGGSGENQMTVRLERPVKVEVSNPEDLALKSAYRDAIDVLERRGNPFPRQFFKWFAGVFAFIWLREAGAPDVRLSSKVLSITVITLMLVAIGTVASTLVRGAGCEIRLSRKADRWWPKNREALTISTVAGVVVGIVIGIPVGVLGSYLYSRLTR